MAMNVTDEQVMNILQFYHRPVYRAVTDYAKAFETKEEITVDNITIYKFTLPFQNIYLDEDGYAVTYNEQKVENEAVFYKQDDDEFFEYVNKYEWIKPEFPSEDYWDDD